MADPKSRYTPVYVSDDGLFTGRIALTPGYDHRDDPSGQKGADGAHLWLILDCPDGVAMTCSVNTGWMTKPLDGAFVPGRKQSRKSKVGVDARLTDIYPSGGAVSIHAPEQLVDWWYGATACEWIGGSCYGDTGYCAADEVLTALVAEGHDGAFRLLRTYYDAWMPQPSENTAYKQEREDG